MFYPLKLLHQSFCMERWRSRNYAASGEADIRHRTLRVTPDSDVTAKVEDKTNTGSAVGAGVVSGAWLGRPGV